MKIVDYETNKTLNDVAVFLNRDEAAELMDFLKRLVDQPQIHQVYLSEIVRNRLERELTIAIESTPRLAA